MFKIFGLVLVALAIAVAVVPHFTDCQSRGSLVALANGNQIPMKCHWTGVAEIGAAIPMAAVGIMTVASRRKETLTYLSITGIALAGVILALPNGLIGTCALATHVCNTLMKPSLTAMGGVSALVGIVSLGFAWRGKGLT